MFKPIITNVNDAHIRGYNRLIGNKPKTGSLQEKLVAQRQWRQACNMALAKAQQKYKV
jgi:hypothetical protein